MDIPTILNKNEKDKIVGEIYIITNTINGKKYVGQTRSHRLNHGKYRKFGSLGRFNDHINEANSTKKNQCRYLNNALLKYGKENFTCEQLLTCKINNLNEFEKQYIITYNSKYPFGYNLTDGGRCFIDVKIDNKLEIINIPNKIIKCHPKSEYTKKLISERLKSVLNTEDNRTKRMKLTQQQHLKKKYNLFKDIVIIEKDIDKYIHISNNKNGEYVRIIIDNKRITNFVGKYESIDEIKNRAKNFMLQLNEWRRNQIETGNSLESETTTPFNGNIMGELG